MPGKRARADLALVFSTLIWGATFIVVKDALADVSVLVYIAVRFGLAAAVMGIVFWRSLRNLNIRAAWAGVQIGFFMFGGYVFQTAGLKFTTASKAAFITGASVVLVPLLLAFFGRGFIHRWVWTGALAALGGLYFLTVPPQGFGALNRGDPLVFVCAMMFALHVIFVGRHSAHYSVGALSTVQVATTAVLAVLFLPIFTAIGWERPRLVWTEQLIFAILITSIGSTVLGFSFQVWAQKHTSASHTAILLSLEPVFAAITSWIVANERLGARALAGAALIFIGILLAELKGPATAAPESPEPLAYPLER